MTDPDTRTRAQLHHANYNSRPSSPAIALGEGAVLSLFTIVGTSGARNEHSTESLFAMLGCPQAVKVAANFVRFELPRFNADVDSGSRSLDNLVRGICHAIDFKTLHEAAWNAPRSRLPFEVLKIVGFAVSAAERHGQHAGAAAGATLARLDGAERLLMMLGDLTGLPARDSFYTYWTGNPGHLLSFTGSPEEAYFNFAVNETARVQGQGLVLIDELRNALMIGTRHVEHVRFIGEQLRYLRDEVYRGYYAAAGDVRLGGMTPEFFLKQMRTYLRAYPVGGKMLDAPNATYVPTFPAFDFALGVVNDAYRGRVAERLQWMSRQDQATLTSYMKAPGLLEISLAVAGVDLRDDVAVADIATAIGRNAVQREFFKAFAELLTAWSTLAGTHFGLIRHYVERPGNAMKPEERKLYRTDEGVSGSGLAATKAIFDMRRNHPLFERLKSAVELLDDADKA